MDHHLPTPNLNKLRRPSGLCFFEDKNVYDFAGRRCMGSSISRFFTSPCFSICRPLHLLPASSRRFLLGNGVRGGLSTVRWFSISNPQIPRRRRRRRRRRSPQFLLMPIASFSLFRLRITSSPHPSSATFLRRLSISAKQHQNPTKPPLNKNILRARSTFKDFSSLAPILAPDLHSPLSESQAIGTVAAAQANFMRVIVHSQVSNSAEERPRVGLELLCVVKAVLKKIKRRVLVGDKVVVGSIDWVDRRGVIENVFRRSSEILDPPVANVDHLLLLFSLENPKLEPFSLTRFLVEAESTQIPLTLALNKSELVDEETVVNWKSRLHKWGYEPLFCSVETRAGLDSLAFILRDQTTVVVGPSGVGKSSLINALRNHNSAAAPAESDNAFEPISGSKWFQEQRVGEVSTRSGRGKHTTRHVSLLPLSEGGYLADTPGFNQPSLLKVTKQSLPLAFPEIRRTLSASEDARCAFKDCLHLGEPGCIVKADWERYQYYFQLVDEIRVREEFQLRTFGTKREGYVRYKVGGMGVQQAEPRLEPKKHRRQSRKKLNQSLLDELDEEEELSDEEDDPIRMATRNESQ